jgi:transposase
MKKHSTGKERPQRLKLGGKLTVGVDLGDRSSRYCVVDEQGEVVVEGSLPTTQKGLHQVFGALPRSRVALEVGTHSPWVSRRLTALGHEAIVANARKVRLITDSSRKDDRLDARTLARLARVDPQLLSPIRHRSAAAQADLMQIRARAALVEARTMLVNAARGLTKSYGERIPKCGTARVSQQLSGQLSPEVGTALGPLLAEVASLTQRIVEYERQIEKIARQRYPEAKLLQQVDGVGTLTALSFVLTVEDPGRFRRSREVGCYVGLRPRRRDSGQSQPQLGISKEGDRYLRKLLVEAAHRTLGPFGKDSDLRRWGLKLAEHGGKRAKRRATVAVARKLAVLLHHLWLCGEEYDPLHNSRNAATVAA